MMGQYNSKTFEAKQKSYHRCWDFKRKKFSSELKNILNASI